MSEEKMGFNGPHDPAFPMQSRDGHETFNRPVWGLTKREYYASAMMQALITRAPLGQIVHEEYEMMAKHSVELANALLKALG